MDSRSKVSSSHHCLFSHLTHLSVSISFSFVCRSSRQKLRPPRKPETNSGNRAIELLSLSVSPHFLWECLAGPTISAFHPRRHQHGVRLPVLHCYYLTGDRVEHFASEQNPKSSVLNYRRDASVSPEKPESIFSGNRHSLKKSPLSCSDSFSNLAPESSQVRLVQCFPHLLLKEQ
jgi:hypothetical protein